MFLKLMYFFIFLCLPLLLLMVNYFVNMKSLLTRSLLSSFECGFDTFSNARSSFSLHFFLISIIFLVFDLEIIFLIPLPLWVTSSGSIVIYTALIFISILFLGTIHEWNEGSLNWV